GAWCPAPGRRSSTAACRGRAARRPRRPSRLSAARGGRTRMACRASSCPPPSTHRRGALDRFENADMRAAPALEPFERLLDLGFGRLLLLGEQSGGGHDPAVDAVAALRHLLLDIGGLQRVRLLRRAEAR